MADVQTKMDGIAYNKKCGISGAKDDLCLQSELAFWSA